MGREREEDKGKKKERKELKGEWQSKGGRLSGMEERERKEKKEWKELKDESKKGRKG